MRARFMAWQWINRIVIFEGKLSALEAQPSETFSESDHHATAWGSSHNPLPVATIL